MHNLIKAFFIIGIITVPVALFVALPLIMMPGESYLVHTVRSWAITLGILGGPVMFGLCAMNYQFMTPHFELEKFRPEVRGKATRYAKLFERVMNTLEEWYEAYWTKENRIAFACLAGMTMAFALAQASFSLKPFEVAAVKLGGILSMLVMGTILFIDSRLQKATT